MKKYLIALLILAVASCSNDVKVETPEPYYDDFVTKGYYFNRDRWGTSFAANYPDSPSIQLAIGIDNHINSWNIRRYNNQVGYEWVVTNKRLRFRKTDKGYVIVGDTLEGWAFEKQ